MQQPLPFEQAVVEEAIHPLPVEVHQLGPTSNFVSNLQFLNKPPLLSFVTLPVPKFITRPQNHTQTLSTFHPHPAALLSIDQLASSMLPGCQPNNPDPETIEKEFLSSPPFSETIEFLENLPQISSQENSARFKATEATPRPFQWSRGLVQLPNTTLTCPNADNISNLPPVPLPPYNSPHYKLAMERISNHIHLFPISHSIKIDVLAQKLRTMNFPNIPLLDSLYHSFQHGFWAGNDEPLAHYTRDPLITPNDDNSPEFTAELDKLIEKELKAGFITQSDHLPPYSANVPLSAIFQKTKYRLIRNASKPHGASINDFIPPEHRHTSYDYVSGLVPWLKLFRKHCPPDHRVVVWKGDIRSAFRTQPFHPLLQSRQFIITNDRRIFIDHRSIFGNGAGPHLLTSWSSTLAWFLRHVLPPVNIPSMGDFLHPIFIYMDDFYSICFQLESEFLNNAPPRAMILADQALRPLGIIMEPKKYEHGEFVVVTGFGVNSHDVSLSLSPIQTAHTIDLLDSILALENTAIPFKRFEQLAGTLNWASNVFFLIRPSLTPIYAAMKQVPISARSRYRLTVTPLIVNTLRWLKQYISTAPPFRLLDNEAWLPSQADFFLYTDACLEGMAFFLPDVNILYYHLRPGGYRDQHGQQLPINTIELFCQFWARSCIPDLLHIPSFGSRCLSYVDNTTACSNLNTFKSNNLIQSIIIREAALVEIRSEISFLTHHIPGKINIIADLGSRGQIDEIRRKAPNISCFPTPRLPPLPFPFDICF